jgi:hypothetical protein
MTASGAQFYTSAGRAALVDFTQPDKDLPLLDKGLPLFIERLLCLAISVSHPSLFELFWSIKDSYEMP